MNKLSIIIITIVFIFFNTLVIYNPTPIIQASKNGLLLWFNNVIPSLLPFIIFNNILRESNGFYFLSKLFGKPLSFLLRISPISSVIYVIGCISGYPLGGKTVIDLYNNNSITKEEANHIILFCNNGSPIFIIGTIGVTLLKNSRLGLFLLLIHILSSFIIGFLLRFKINKVTQPYHYTKPNLTFLQVINNSVMTASSTILIIGCYIILFSVIISILDSCNIINYLAHTLNLLLHIDPNLSRSIIIGMLEMTNGINYLSSYPINIVSICCTSFILGFGGICVHAQTLSNNTCIDVPNYIRYKLFHGVVSCILSLLFYNSFMF